MANPSFESDYRREYGVHSFELKDGTQVSALSFPNWEDFYQQLIDLPETKGYVVSPELITSPSPLNEIRSQKEEIVNRTNSVAEVSAQHPDAMFLLGSASFDSSDNMRNSIVVIQNGSILGHIDKRGKMWATEAREFSRDIRQQAELMNLGHSALVCSDLIIEQAHTYPNRSPYKFINKDTETILLSSCWAVPQYDDLPHPTSADERFKKPLEFDVQQLFNRYPHLREIVMVDRAIPEVGNEPYTAHFKSLVTPNQE